MKKLFKHLIQSTAKILNSTRLGVLVREAIMQGGMETVRRVQSRGVSLRFTAPNQVNRFRLESFATKEPETLDWIDQLPKGCTLWDVGANVGLYSIYAAKKRECRVVAFEPSVFNLELLARNLFLNGLQDQVGIVPMPLSDGLGMNQMRMTSTNWGGALSSFGQDFGWDGKSITTTFAFQTLGISMDDVVSLLRFTPPDFIKMDVDGIEHVILRGGTKVLAGIQGILIEINDGFEEQAKESERLLRRAGLKLKEKLHAPMFEDSKFAAIFNQIWVRE